MAWGFDAFVGFASASPEDEMDGVVPPFSQPEYYGDARLETVEQFVAAIGYFVCKEYVANTEKKVLIISWANCNEVRAQ